MNTNETIKILAVLKAAYPNFYSKQSADDLKAVVNLWSLQFKDFPYDVVNASIQSLISSRTDTFPPVIGEIKEEIHKLTMGEEITPLEAWEHVQKAISNSAYNSREEWEKLPSIVRSVVTPEYLHECATSPTYNPGVEGSNFQKSFKIKQQREREDSMLPAEIKNLLSQCLRIGDGNGI